MSIELRPYQFNAISGLYSKLTKVLSEPSEQNGVVIFQAPTGSGKTLMVSEVIKKLITEYPEKLAFIWISVRMLHKQSKEKLDEYYKGNNNIKCSYYEELLDNCIEPGEILFLNWDSINKTNKNIFIRGFENFEPLDVVIANTKSKNTKIVLIIDESHHTAASDRSIELINIISPAVTLEVSATPQIKNNVSEIERVSISSVCEDGMIKNDIIINPEIDQIRVDYQTTNEFIILHALRKRDELKQAYINEGSNVNPLLLIQLPDSMEGMNYIQTDVIRVLSNNGYGPDSGKLSIWLSEEKTDNLNNISDLDSPVDVLIFKQAIAVGWDCPRASILLIFRESKNFVFTIQTVGRIMRMPELNHYSNPILNSGYIFTNLESMRIIDDYIKDYIIINKTKRKDIYNNLDLVSFVVKNKHKYLEIEKDICRLMTKTFNELMLNTIINSRDIQDINMNIISDVKLNNIYINTNTDITDDTLSTIRMGDSEIAEKFYRFVASVITKNGAKDPNHFIENHLVKLIKDTGKFGKNDVDIHKLIFDINNACSISELIERTIAKYKHNKLSNIINSKSIVSKIWNVPEIDYYNKDANTLNINKSIMDPFYYTKLSDPERRFIEYLDSNNDVVWWYKNGEHNEKYFSIVYTENSELKNFYLDFIVQLKFDCICLFDTKSGFTLDLAKDKFIALKRYIEDRNHEGKHINGGIIVYKNNTFYLTANINNNNIFEFQPFTI